MKLQSQTTFSSRTFHTYRKNYLGVFEAIPKVAALVTTGLHAMNSAHAYTYKVAKASDRGEVTRQDAAACVLCASEQAMGGTGYMNESTVSRLMRDAKLMEIGAGTSEIRRMLIGRELMGAMG